MSKTLGEMTPAERDAAIRSAAAVFQAELEVSAPRIAEVLAEDTELHRCSYCGMTGDVKLFEPFNQAGNLACKATAACEIRQQGDSPARVLGLLLRAVRRELGTLTTAELAALAIELAGEPGEFLGGFYGDVRVYLSARGDSAAALEAECADRKHRARSRAARAGAATRAARKAGK